MKRLVVALGLAAGLLGSAGTAPAQVVVYPGYHHHHYGYYPRPYYPSYGWGGYYYPRPYYYPGTTFSFSYGYPGYYQPWGWGYPAYGYGYSPGFSFGLTIIR